MAYTQQTPIGTPDVNLITKTLAGLQPDSALQQYAMLHKNNPYILSLAKSESDRRKQLRTAAQGQVGQQPTVVDQNIAGMAQQQLPENQGIAQIPTPNMQSMADGGIAGYADDEEGMATGGMGGMFNFAQQSEPVVRMSGGGVARYNGATGSVTGVPPELLSKYQQEATEMAMGTRMQFSPDVKAVVGKIQAAQENSYLKEEQKQMLEGSPLRNKKQDSVSMVAPTAPTAPTASTASAAYDPTENLKKLAQTNARYTTPSEPKNAEEAAMLNRYPATMPVVDKTPPAAAPAPQGNLPTGLASIAQAKQAGEELYGTKDLERKIEQNRLQQRTDITNEKEESAAKLAAFNKTQGPAMAGYSKLLDSQEKADVSDKEKAGLMALFKGFLGIAAGESPNAAVNIAKGSMVGLEDYNSSLKDLKKAAKERDKERAYIENAQRAEGREDFKSQQAFENKANDAARAADNHAIDAVTKITGLKGEGSARVYSEMLQQQSANARTNAQINAPSGIERIVDRMARDPKFAESYKNYASIGPEAKGYEAELQAYLKNPMIIKATNPELAAQFDAIIKQRMLKPTSTPTGPVRD
jgi:hypothetical protein